MSTDRADHWNQVFRSRATQDLTWYQDRPDVSLALITDLAGVDASVVDVGAGQSTLAAHLVELGFSDLTLLDISEQALSASRALLPATVGTLCVDVTAWVPQRQWDVWHDRAVLHFLTQAADQAAYVAALRQALPVGGHAVIATFAVDGPTKCSGLAVVRYSPDQLLELVGPDDFELVLHRRETHRTPRGGQQHFQTSVLRRR